MNELESIQRILGKNKQKNHVGRINSKQVNRHVWSIEEEKLVMELYKNKSSEQEIIEKIKDTKLKLSSVKMKLQNIRYLDIGEGLENVSEVTKSLFNKVKV
jgi:hypothetical protein